VLADASEITGLPRDNFEVREIMKEELRLNEPQTSAALRQHRLPVLP
jgi:hypothetical protein